MRNQLLLILALLVFAPAVNAQDAKPTGKFLKDSAKVGEEITYSLSFQYPRNWQILFPDSLSDYGSFEYINRIYFPTRTDSLLSKDSVVYFLQTFELDEIQSLQSAISIRKPGAALQSVISDPAEIRIVPILTQMPDSLNFIQNTQFGTVRTKFNYPYFIAALVALLVLSVVGWSIFGARIQRWMMSRKLRKAHETFLHKFKALHQDLSADIQVYKAENLLILWKNHMEFLEKMPVSKWTTKEILKHLPGYTLETALKTIDRCVYAGSKDASVVNSFGDLEVASQIGYENANKRIAQYRDGE